MTVFRALACTLLSQAVPPPTCTHKANGNDQAKSSQTNAHVQSTAIPTLDNATSVINMRLNGARKSEAQGDGVVDSSGHERCSQPLMVAMHRIAEDEGSRWIGHIPVDSWNL